MKYDESRGLARATADPQVLMVGKNSPFKTGTGFLAAGKGKAQGGTTHDRQRRPHRRCSASHARPGCSRRLSVPFRGGGDIVINLVGGNLDCGMLNFAEAESQIKAGDARA